MVSKIAVSLLFVCVTLSGCSSFNTPENTLTLNDVQFDKNTGTIVDYVGNRVSITIPDDFDGVAVTAIGDKAFSNDGLVDVTIPDSVEAIGTEAFASNKLTSIIIPDSVKYIGRLAFYKNQLTSITIPGSVAIIENHAFTSNQLTNVIISDSVVSVGLHAFEDNPLTNVTVSNSVNLDAAAFNPNVIIIRD